MKIIYHEINKHELFWPQKWNYSMCNVVHLHVVFQ